MISNAASLSHSEPHKGIPGQNGGERKNGAAKQGIRPGQSGDEGSTTPTSRTDPDKAWTKRSRGKETHGTRPIARPSRRIGGQGRDRTRGGHRVGQHSQRTTGRQEEDKRRTRGGRWVGQRGQRTTVVQRGQNTTAPGGNSRTRGGQDRTQSSGARPASVASSFSLRDPQQ